MQQVRLALVVGLMLASLEALTDVVVRDPAVAQLNQLFEDCLLYTSPSPRDKRQSRMPSSA